ncbi:Cation efflux family [Novymonas esmeraldas]|uniref:Cation efflux family n=1 Tax=Novymonas esmeraldas TaxID=1808958 RepID=A0AAW0F3F4_9TRYP
MIEEACSLFCAPSRGPEHRRRQRAAVVFWMLWVLSLLSVIATAPLIVSVQALVLLNTATSLTAAVVTRSMCSRAATQEDYPFGFGVYRLGLVVRLGGIVFLVFGCLSTVVEALHRGVHAHHLHPVPLLCTGAAQLVAQLVFYNDVRLTDRISGLRGIAGAHSEDVLHQTYVASSIGEGLRVGGGGDLRKPAGVSGPTVSSGTAPVAHSSGGSAALHSVDSTPSSVAAYLMCPVVCLAAAVVMMATDSPVPDTVVALLLSIYYGYVGFTEGRGMLDVLMNKCVTSQQRLRSLERCLRNVRMVDGVLQVQSNVWWTINAAESMLLIRVRLMSGSDARVVSQAVRKQLVEVATHVYVECFPANGANGLGDAAPMSWATSLAHRGHVQCSVDDGHSHDNGHCHTHDCGAHHTHIHGEEEAAATPTTAAVRGSAVARASNGAVHAPASVESTGRLTGAAAAPGGAARHSTAAAFPMPPTSMSGTTDPLAERLRLAGRVTASTHHGGAASASALPAFPAGTYAKNGGGGVGVEAGRIYPPGLRGAAAVAGSVNFPIAAAVQGVEAPPPTVFAPFRERVERVAGVGR